MPRPEWVEARKLLKKASKDVENIVDTDEFATALDDVETDPQAAAKAKQDPKGYLEDRGVKIPPGLEIVEITHSSPAMAQFKACAWGFCITITISF